MEVWLKDEVVRGRVHLPKTTSSVDNNGGREENRRRDGGGGSKLMKGIESNLKLFGISSS